MSQHTGRIKPGMKAFGKPTQPRRSTRAKTVRDSGGGPKPAMKGQMTYNGIAVTKRRV